MLFRSAIEQLEKQEPVAWMYESVCGNDFVTRITPPSYAKNIRLLYTHPPVIDKSAAIRIATALGWQPPKEWQGLTDEEMLALMKEVPHLTIGGFMAVQAKLKEKNHA